MSKVFVPCNEMNKRRLHIIHRLPKPDAYSRGAVRPLPAPEGLVRELEKSGSHIRGYGSGT
jgi:hypothetical protein